MPDRRSSTPAASPDAASGVDRRTTGSVGAIVGLVALATLLGGEEIPVEGLPAVADLDLDAGRGGADTAGDPLGLGEIGTVAVEDGQQLEARLERLHRRQDRLLAVAVRGDEAVVGTQRDRVAALHFAPA